jgi:hypothetical protein
MPNSIKQYITHILAGKPETRIYCTTEQNEHTQPICMSILVHCWCLASVSVKKIKQNVIKNLIPVLNCW